MTVTALYRLGGRREREEGLSADGMRILRDQVRAAGKRVL